MLLVRTCLDLKKSRQNTTGKPHMTSEADQPSEASVI